MSAGVHTIDGNTSGAGGGSKRSSGRVVRKIRNRQIVGYGRPDDSQFRYGDDSGTGICVPVSGGTTGVLVADGKGLVDQDQRAATARPAYVGRVRWVS